MNKIQILVLTLVLLLFSCKEQKKKPATTTQEIENITKQDRLRLNAFCFYELDDKYSATQDSIAVNIWLREKSLLLLKTDSVDNIFHQNGGGPNGAEWNPSANLYIAVHCTSDKSTPSSKLYVNGQLYTKQLYTHAPNLNWYILKRDFWEEELKRIDSVTIKELYSPEFLKSFKKEEIYQSEYLREGKVLRFEIVSGEERLTSFFHATFGE